MKYLAATLAAACAVLLGVVAYQAVPDKADKPVHTAAYQRIDRFLAAIKAHHFKKACAVLQWYSANQFVTDDQCAVILKYQFGGNIDYRMLGEVVGRENKYVVVIAEMVLADPSTKADEIAFCQAKWAGGKGCIYAGVYTFGTALVGSPADVLAGKKHARLHWYIDWIH